MRYLRLTKTLNSVGKLIPENENPYNYIKDDLDKDYYLSIYTYSEEQKDYAIEKVEKVNKKTKETYVDRRGVSGITEVVTNKLVFDFDHDDLKIAQQDSVTCVKRLKDLGIKPDDINISFSGNKGFSIVVNHDTDLSPERHKAIASSLAGDLASWDTKVYNASRIFRLDYTKHQASNLYKTPLVYAQLSSVEPDTLKQVASRKRKPNYIQKTAKLPKQLLEIKPKEKAVAVSNIDIDADIDFTKKPNFLSREKFVLHKGHIPKGYGNEGMMILAATYKNAGYDAVDAYNMLKGVNEKRIRIFGEQAGREEEEIQDTVIDVVYSDAWNGGEYSPKGNELLASIKEKYGKNEHDGNLKKINEISDRFKSFINNINDNIIKSGIESLDQKVMLMTGQLVGVLGAPGSGKTSLVTTIMENLSSQGTRVLFESLDMHDNMMILRMIQKLTGLNTDVKMRKMMKTDPNYEPGYNMFDDPEVIKAMGEMDQTYKNVHFNFKRGTTVEDIDKHIFQAKQEQGPELKLVVIDYLEKVPSQYSDATASSGFVARQLSDLASKHDVCIMLLLQPQKSAGDASEELLSMRKVKGASVIEQDCRVILTMWRPGFNPSEPENDQYVSLAVVKNNMGDVCKLDFGWDGLRGKFRELNNFEKVQLKEMIIKIKDRKIQEKKEENSW